jgi:gamma-glutamyl-gamma-aminobutyrate hydrolase PuuD
MLTGGADIDPARYGEPRHETVEKSSPERDEMESRLIKWADEQGVPLFAICRGMQMLNLARGGSLHQHIPDSFPGSTCDHRKNSDPKWEEAHDVRIEPGTALASIVGAGVIPVNSRHHQAVNRLGSGLVVTACAPDGVIEGVELAGERFVLGVQWHPEDMAGHFASADALFAAFVSACH